MTVTANGAVRGLADGAVDEFLGIPYAAPPTGARRWHAPEPACLPVERHPVRDGLRAALPAAQRPPSGKPAPPRTACS